MKLFTANAKEAVAPGKTVLKTSKPLFQKPAMGSSETEPELNVERLKDVLKGSHVMRCCAKSSCVFK